MINIALHFTLPRNNTANNTSSFFALQDVVKLLIAVVSENNSVFVPTDLAVFAWQHGCQYLSRLFEKDVSPGLSSMSAGIVHLRVTSLSAPFTCKPAEGYLSALKLIYFKS